MKLSEIKVGDKASIRKTVTEGDVYTYAGITGDQNPMHVDKLYGEASQFGSRIAHGMFTAGYVSAVLGMKLPGPGCIYMSQEMRFVAPVRFGDTIDTVCEVIEVIPEKKRVVLSTTCTNFMYLAAGAELSFTVETPYFSCSGTPFSANAAREMGRCFAVALRGYHRAKSLT